MSHASLGMQQQLLCQYCHGQCAFLTCVCFREDKESTCCWPWQVPSVLAGLGVKWFHVVQVLFTFRPLNDCRRAAEKQKIPILLLVINSIASSGVRGWHLIRSRAAMTFCLTTSLVAPISPFPVPQYPRYLHASSRFMAWRVASLIVYSGAGSSSLRFLSFSITNKYIFFTLIYNSRQAVNPCTTFKSFCMPSGVSAKIEISSRNPTLLNWYPFSSRWLSPFWSLPICSPWLIITSFYLVIVSMRSKALIKMLKSCGDVILPCATPVLMVIVALTLLFGASLTVAPTYICQLGSNKSTNWKTPSSPARVLLETWRWRCF